MNRRISKSILILLALALAVSISGCNNEETPDIPPMPIDTISPLPTDVPAPPTIQFIGNLALNTIYYFNGDSSMPSVEFYEDGTFMALDFHGEYIVSGDVIEIMVDGEMLDEMTIIDEYTLESHSDGSRLIRPGGEGFHAVVDPFDNVGIRILYLEEFYFLSGDVQELNLYFRGDGTVDLSSSDGDKTGDYLIFNYVSLVIFLDGDIFLTLTITNAAELLDEETDVWYRLEGAENRELVAGDYYFLDGDPRKEGVRFDDHGGFVLDTPLGDSWPGTYTIIDGAIHADLDGEILVLNIINNFVLASDDWTIFMRMP